MYYVLIIDSKTFEGPFDCAVAAAQWGQDHVRYAPWRVVSIVPTIKL